MIDWHSWCCRKWPNRLLTLYCSLKIQAMKKFVLLVLYLSIHLSESCKERHSRYYNFCSCLDHTTLVYFIYFPRPLICLVSYLQVLQKEPNAQMGYWVGPWEKVSQNIDPFKNQSFVTNYQHWTGTSAYQPFLTPPYPSGGAPEVS